MQNGFPIHYKTGSIKVNCMGSLDALRGFKIYLSFFSIDSVLKN